MRFKALRVNSCRNSDINYTFQLRLNCYMVRAYVAGSYMLFLRGVRDELLVRP
jgi:hypothetical protein